jgi:hypothetical protein
MGVVASIGYMFGFDEASVLGRFCLGPLLEADSGAITLARRDGRGAVPIAIGGRAVSVTRDCFGHMAQRQCIQRVHDLYTCSCGATVSVSTTIHTQPIHQPRIKGEVVGGMGKQHDHINYGASTPKQRYVHTFPFVVITRSIGLLTLYVILLI